MTSPCAAGINYYSLVPPKANELAFLIQKASAKEKSLQNLDSNKPGRANTDALRQGSVLRHNVPGLNLYFRRTD